MTNRLFKSIILQPGRSIMLGCLMVILSIALSVSFLIRQGGVNVNKEFLDTIKPDVAVIIPEV